MTILAGNDSQIPCSNDSTSGTRTSNSFKLLLVGIEADYSESVTPKTSKNSNKSNRWCCPRVITYRVDYCPVIISRNITSWEKARNRTRSAPYFLFTVGVDAVASIMILNVKTARIESTLVWPLWLQISVY